MKTSKGIIVALIPNDDYVKFRPGVSNPHLTLTHFGTTDDESFNEQALLDYWAMLQKIWKHSIQANVTAESAFYCGEDGWAYVDLINAPYMPELYTVATEAATVSGLNVGKAYGLLPHITKRYVKGQQHAEIVHRPVRIPFAFDVMGLWIGDDHHEIALA